MQNRKQEQHDDKLTEDEIYITREQPSFFDCFKEATEDKDSKTPSKILDRTLSFSVLLADQPNAKSVWAAFDLPILSQTELHYQYFVFRNQRWALESKANTTNDRSDSFVSSQTTSFDKPTLAFYQINNINQFSKNLPPNYYFNSEQFILIVETNNHKIELEKKLEETYLSSTSIFALNWDNRFQTFQGIFEAMHQTLNAYDKQFVFNQGLLNIIHDYYGDHSPNELTKKQIRGELLDLGHTIHLQPNWYRDIKKELAGHARMMANKDHKGNIDEFYKTPQGIAIKHLLKLSDAATFYNDDKQTEKAYQSLIKEIKQAVKNNLFRPTLKSRLPKSILCFFDIYQSTRLHDFLKNIDLTKCNRRKIPGLATPF